ncbi:MAG: class I SAM-dependent methyltransferase [Lachnospiraceae bacterium]|nr:class I SAM-dependent methyltransferase [Lachnospiraceae bacterium]
MIKKKLRNALYEHNEGHRNRWIRKEIKALPSGIKFLDAGAGECKWRSECSHLTYISQDFCQYEGSGDGRGLQTGKWDTHRIDIVSDITDIPVQDGEFDAVLCSEVLEHVPHPELAVKELARVTKQGGTLLLTAPFNSLTHFAPYHFCTGFNIYWYEKHLQENGFEIVETENCGDYFTYFEQELARLGSVVKRYTKKGTFLVKLLSLLLLLRLEKISRGGGQISPMNCNVPGILSRQ